MGSARHTILPANGRWHLYYTGVNHAENGLIQRIGHAVSDDMLTWVKDDSFLLEADARWYEQLNVDVWFDLTWRDPWVYYDESVSEYRMLITARVTDGPADGRGTIGYARSADLETWEILPPLTEPGDFGHLEVPQLVSEGDRWYLFFSAYEWAHSAARLERASPVCGTHYLVSDASTGPFRLLTDTFLSGDERGELYAGRVERDPNGRLVFLAFLQFVGGGAFVGGLSDPIPIVVREDGTLQLDREEDWSAITRARISNRFGAPAHTREG